MRIAIVGTRGLPPSYGGYETFAHYFVKHMIPLGHEVVVACERPASGDQPTSYLGAELVYFPFKPPSSYSLRKIYEGLNDLYFYLRLSKNIDIMYILAGVGTQALILLRILRPKLKIVTNNDGLEWNRSKYNLFEKMMWKSFVKNSLRFSHLVVHDNPKLIDFFPKHRTEKSITIEYGVEKFDPIEWDTDYIKKNLSGINNVESLSPHSYFLVVARLQHDNNTHKIIEGYIRSGSRKSLVIVGDVWDSGYNNTLESLISKAPEGKVIMTGGIYNSTVLNMLRQKCFAYIHGHSAGGTNPSLVEAMAMGRAIIAHGNPFNRHVLGDNGMFFSEEEEISGHILSLQMNLDLVNELGQANLERASTNYQWTRCFSEHDHHFRSLLQK